MSKILNNWQRRGLGVLAVGGGALGLASGVLAVLHGQVPASSNALIMALGTAFFLWSVWCGVQMLEGSRHALFRNAIFWLAQTPLLQTSVLGYTAFCGAQLQVFIKLAPFEVGFFGSVLGAQFGLNPGQPGARTAVGVNLVALCVSFWLMRRCIRAEPALLPVTTK